MGAIVTSKFRTQNLMVFIDQFEAAGANIDNNYLYLGFGRSQPWADDAWGYDEGSGNFTLPTPLDEDEQQFWDDIVGAKRIRQEDMSPVLPRVDWDTGDSFAFEGDTDAGITGVQNPGRSFISKLGRKSVVLNSEYNVYQCVGEPATGSCWIGGVFDGGTSTSRAACETVSGGLWIPTQASEQPTGNNNGSTITTIDDYAWKFLYKLELQDIINSTTNDWMPVIYGSGVAAGSDQLLYGDVNAIFNTKCHHALIHIRLETTDNFPDNDDFRQIGLLRNPETNDIDGDGNITPSGTKAENLVYASATTQMTEDSGQLIYLENRRAITRASDQIEDLKLVVEF